MEKGMEKEKNLINIIKLFNYLKKEEEKWMN